ncbi:terminase family protein [Streptomyces sp. MP131-18]|uniref:terminase large subunit domain-containing protein n=1 Tax=Streptomyces sp. MP131-18 TaxID=1857892 RepID=UPI00097CB326|nr:terminase family protein [Streptomyces sp. MP131-18]ONK13153.1 hypothetical protein STBA_39150 [Streptomyces sp. MP131-18]
MADALDHRALARLAQAARQANQDALNDPATIARYLDARFFPRPHLEYMALELARLATGETTRLLLMLPPQSGKSTLAAVWTPFWWLARRPHDRVIIGSYGQQLAMHRGRAIRRLIDAHGWRWNLKLAAGSTMVTDWQTETGGGVKSVGVGGGVTGFPANLAVIDDPHKNRAEADSRAIRDRVWSWYSADFMTRLSPGAPLCMMLTPWHWDDLAHRVLERDGRQEEGGLWRVIALPAFATSPHDALGRAVGDPLPHPQIPVDDIEAARAHWTARRAQIEARDWAALYQLDPQPLEGALLSTDILQRQRHFDAGVTPQRIAVAVDPSGGGRDTAGVVGGYLGSDQRLYLTHDHTKAMSSAEWARAACLLAAETGAQIVLVERNYGGDMVDLAIRTAWDALQRENAIPSGQLPPYVQPVHAKVGKALRAEPIAQQWREDRVRTAAYLPELEMEWATWQPGSSESPGRIDASVYLAYGLLRPPNTAQVISSPAGISLAQASAQPGGLGSVRLGRTGP